MSLSLDQTKGVMRLLGALEQLRQAAPPGATGTVLTPALRSVKSLREQALELFRDDPDLLAELDRTVPAPEGWRSAPSAIAALEGWLRGLANAERFEAEIREKAKAWVAEQVRASRKTGFE